MTAERMSHTYATCSELSRPGHTNQRQKDKSTDTKVVHRSPGANVLDPCQKKNDTIIKLIGSKALTQCNLNGLTVRALLDTDAQVSIVDRMWKDKKVPNIEVRPLRDLLGCENDLEVYAVNGNPIPFDGWTIITVNLLGNGTPTCPSMSHS